MFIFDAIFAWDRSLQSVTDDDNICVKVLHFCASEKNFLSISYLVI